MKFKKLLPFTQAGTEKPLHAGEIYYMWETLTTSYNLITLAETYMMNTEDKELHILLKGLITGAYLTRISRLEKTLKEEGFTVPPQPSPKSLQGKPGVGQEVKLDDDEVIRDLTAWGQVLMQHDVRAVGAATRESVRKVFTDILNDDVKAYAAIYGLGKRRRVYSPPPPATAKNNSLDFGEVFTIWDQLGARHKSIVNLEVFIANSNDPELVKILKDGLEKLVIPQMEQLENKLKEEGFTIPPRPVRRMKQGPPGQVNKITMSDSEVIRLVIAALQVAISQHVRSFTIAGREDVSDMFKHFLSSEIEYYQKMMALASARNVLNNPPVVTSKRG